MHPGDVASDRVHRNTTARLGRKLFLALLVGLGAIFCSCPAFATQITFSTAQNTALLYTLSAADLASYDPGGAFGIYDDTNCDTGTIATLHGGTANMDGGSPDTIYYTPPGGYIGSDTVTFFNTTNGANCVAQQAIVTVYGPLIISSPVILPVPAYGVAYSQTITTTGGLAPITFSRSAGTLPAGLALSSAGLLHGTPTGTGTYNFTVRAVDSASQQFNRGYSGTIAAAIAISTATLPTPVLNVAYSQTVATTGGTAPIAFSIFSGSLPAGLSINSASGVISGTPSAAGAYSFTVRALDANSVAANQAYSGTIATSLAIGTATLPTPVLNVAYSQTVATTGGTAPIAFSIFSGSLPAGLSINSASGVISGTPSAAGAYSFTVRALDANSVAANQPYSGTIAAAIAISTATLPTPVLNVAYSQTVATTGGTAPIAFSIFSGSLPVGLSINSASGVISGTPSAAGAYSFTVRALDANSVAADQAYSGTIAASLAISTATLPTPALAVAYSQTVTTTGGTAPIAFDVQQGSLPAGLTLDTATGAITGTPTAAGAYAFTIRATDANALTASQAYSGTIATSLAISSTTLPTPLIGAAYSQAVMTSGGTAPITFSITTGTLPNGLSLSVSGTITGTPTTSGSYSFTITVTDAHGIAVSRTYSGTIAASLAISSATLPTPVIGVAYSQTVTTTGGTAPITFASTAGALPTGLTLDSATGAITGTPTAAGAYSFTIRATDTNSIAASQAYSGTIGASLAIGSATLPTPVIGVAYSQTVTTTGGTAPITFASTAGALPTGLTLNSATGAITGTPTSPGAYSFTIRASDANAITANQTYSGTIGASLTIGSTTLPTPVISVAYSQTITTTGGTAPITFASTAGALPTGLTLNTATGAITGTPTSAGAYTFTIRASDANAIMANQTYSGTIGASLAIGSTTLPTPVIGVAYSQTITTTGGTAPITFASTAGALPTGLTLNSATGAITGTPTSAGAYTFTIRATDANAIGASQAYSGTIGASLAIGSTTLPTPVIGVAYSQTVTTTGGTAPITFAITAGALPTGLTLNTASGAITGTPTSAGAYTFTIRATDANAIGASQAYSGTIGASLAIGSTTLPTPVIGVAYSQSITTTGGTAPITFASTAGTLPAGLTLNTASGAIAGTPTAPGAYNFTIRATDVNAITANQTYSGTIGASLAINSATLPTPVIGAAYTGTVTTTGGAAPILFAVTAGTLPAGLTLNTATGSIAGTPTVAGSYTFTIRATDANAITASQSYSGTISATLTIGTATLPTPVIGVAYSQSVTATGGTAPITFALTTGTLPTGLALNTATGAITGTPTAAGAYTFTIRAVDAAAQVATQTYSGTIGAVPSLTALSPNSGPTAGGTTVNITGTSLTGATAVLFGNTPATAFTVLSATSIAATSPAGSGSATVSVIAPGGTTQATSVGTFTWAVAPSITSISPNSGAFAGGTVVTITGHGFTHATAVYFGSTAAATFNVASNTSISATTARASANAAQPADARRRPASVTPASAPVVGVSVVTAGGTSPPTAAASFAFSPAVVPIPTVARLSPAHGPSAGGTSVTITGSALSGATAVRFGTATAAFTVTNSTSLIALAPAGSGTVNVTVTTPGGTSAASSAAYTYKATATTVAVTSSLNPAAARTPVTFRATVASSGATPTGSVRFKDGATVIGTIALVAGVAELTTSALGIGTHAIAVDYGGNARFAPSTSPAIAQAISVPADSQKLRAVQLAASKLVAQASGQAISSAIDSAISNGFSGNAPLITPSATGVKFNLAEAGSRHPAAMQPTSGLQDAGRRTKSHLYDAAAPPDTGGTMKPALPHEWLVWADVQRTGITHTGTAAATTIYGDQINALAGVTRKVSPNLLVGVLGGYETFDYRSDALSGRLNGNGTTVGAYLGWKFVRGLRFDLAGAHTAIDYGGVAGTASGAFAGSRWLVSSGLIGTYAAAAFAVEPSAKVYALWESQPAYTDSLGTPQATSTFTTGRTSAGAKLSTLPKTTNFISPYAGFYADYYFNGDNVPLATAAAGVPLASEKILAGWSARALAGFAARLGDATTVACDVEYGGIGSTTRLLKYRCDAGVPLLRSRRTDK